MTDQQLHDVIRKFGRATLTTALENIGIAVWNEDTDQDLIEATAESVNAGDIDLNFLTAIENE